MRTHWQLETSGRSQNDRALFPAENSAEFGLFSGTEQEEALNHFSGRFRIDFKTFWPDATQELLLRAALLEGQRAHDALTAWKRATGFVEYSDIDFLATYLLPRVYGNLTRSGIADPWLSQLAGLHRYHWTRNATRKREMLDVVERLHAAGLKFVIWGGFALLAAQYFNDLGERPLLDAQLLLAPADAVRARQVFASVGWRAAKTPPPVAGWRSEGWCGKNDQTIQVHYRWLPKPFAVVGVDRVLRHATIADFGGVKLHIPDAADLLTQAFVGRRRLQGDSSGQFVWVADAMSIIERNGSDLDWERFWLESGSLGTLLPLRDSLEYLRTTIEAAVSDAWLAKAAEVNMPPAREMTNRSLKGYVVAEQAAGRIPSIGGLLRYIAWRASVELRKATHFGSKRAPVRHG